MEISGTLGPRSQRPHKETGKVKLNPAKQEFSCPLRKLPEILFPPEHQATSLLAAQ